jgi:hypothetical protein
MIEKPIEITEPILLMVEGSGDELFFKALLKYHGLQNVQIINAGGKDAIGPKLEALTSSPQFRTTVISLGVVRDADTDTDLAFKCVTDALESANLPVPESALVPKGDNPQVTVMILPGGGKHGMLEDLCLKSVESDPAMFCVKQYCQCLQQKCPSLPKNTSKAKVQVFLASRKEVEKGLGVAARDGCWPFHDAAFDEVKRFIETVSNC